MGGSSNGGGRAAIKVRPTLRKERSPLAAPARQLELLGEVDLAGNWNELVELPSGGDTSYPGMALRGSQLLVSYYSSHEEKTAVYLARLRLRR